MMTKICTDVEQSNKLIELGIDVNTADMCYHFIEINKTPICIRWEKVHDDEKDNSIPAWSLTALLKLTPSEFITENKFGKYKYEIKIRKYKLTDDVDIYQIGYGNYKWHEDGSCSWKDMINTGEKEELLDAAFEMVCWLKENGRL